MKDIEVRILISEEDLRFFNVDVGLLDEGDRVEIAERYEEMVQENFQQDLYDVIEASELPKITLDKG